MRTNQIFSWLLMASFLSPFSQSCCFARLVQMLQSHPQFILTPSQSIWPPCSPFGGHAVLFRHIQPRLVHPAIHVDSFDLGAASARSGFGSFPVGCQTFRCFSSFFYPDNHPLNHRPYPCLQPENRLGYINLPPQPVAQRCKVVAIQSREDLACNTLHHTSLAGIFRKYTKFTAPSPGACLTSVTH
jgi:hypothetical protein